ncbi:MAG: TonB-dependent receptor [Cytophagales bacterium]|nr:TonB-dependent receptor [Cytophagales bacterium]
MKLNFTALLFLIALLAQAQERIISGRLTSTDDGSPLPGINITIKGSSTGTVTDANGYYSIRVPIGATLVYSFIGMQTREVVVTENNLKSGSSGNQRIKETKNKSVPVPRSFYDTVHLNQTGLATFTDDMPAYRSTSKINPATIRAIKIKGKTYYIKSDTDPTLPKGFAIQYANTFGLEQINKLPALQRAYAQGRTNGSSLQWVGADQQEIFSWGPLTRMLEFDGSPNDFDKNGSLVPVGTGIGNAAKIYNPMSLFRTGFVQANELTFNRTLARNGSFNFDAEHRTRSGVIPNSRYQKVNLAATLKNFYLKENLHLNGSVSFNRSTGNLLNRGANLTSIIGAVYRTPVTFDNTNALAKRAAINGTESYRLPDGTLRSHAAGLVDNPYGLISQLPDTETLNRLLATTNLRYQPKGKFDFVFNGNLDQQWNTSRFGIPPGYSGTTAGRLTRRNDNQAYATSIFAANYLQSQDNNEFKLALTYQTEYLNRELNRLDGFGFQSQENFSNPQQADSVASLNRDQYRTTHQLTLKAHYEWQWLNAFILNRNYFSNTVNYQHYVNLFPTASISVDIKQLLDLWSINQLKLYSTTSRSIREAPLLYSNWSYQSLALQAQHYSQFYESDEILFNRLVAPETEWKSELGLKFDANRLSAEVSWFGNTTANFIAPVNSPQGFRLSNTATIQNRGWLISGRYITYIPQGNWSIDLKWSKYNSVVKELYSPADWIALAGFSEVQQVLATDKPVGAIYGTSYLKNDADQIIIGADGFPIKDSNLKMIGNPIPDWTLSLASYTNWKQFKLSILFDFKKGGEMWNGTSSALDYLGRSQHSGEYRNLSIFLFEGVNDSGNPNLVPVSFYNPANPLADNRWVRYGWDGVGEDYIEDTSWIRLTELALSYTTRYKVIHGIKSIRLSLIGRNLFVITPYTGVDPAASLFGYSTTQGLDLFNTPSVRSYTAQITLTF